MEVRSICDDNMIMPNNATATVYTAYPVLKDFSRADPQPLLPWTHAFTPTV